MKKHLALLGLEVEDVVTGFRGICESVTFDLYGCVLAVVKPPVDKAKPGELPDPKWFDLKRLRKIGDKKVMDVPSFDEPPGPGAKPAFPSMPAR